MQTIWEKDDFTISTDKKYLDTEAIFNFLHNESYWAQGIAKELVLKAIANTPICFGVYEGDPSKERAKQVGYARLITDFVRFAWLADVFIVKEYRGHGLSKWLMQVITEHEELKAIRRIMLATNDAHTLYAQFGFTPLEKPENFMQLFRK